MIDKDSDSPSRRLFFRDALAHVIRPLADYLEHRVSALRPRLHLRPPGAIEESQLIETCRRCGACVDSCPAHAIFPLRESAGAGAGTPAIDPDAAACVVCDGLLCTTVCPSGALLPLSTPSEIRMGTAEVYGSLCVRSQDEACTLCVDRCPMGESAIRFDGSGPPTVLEAGCVGCGVCQLACPTNPKAIVVTPR